MAQIIIDTPAGADGTRILNALAASFGYEPLISNGGGTQVANPESKTAFVKRKVADLLKGMVVAYEAGQAAETARATAKTSADSLVIT